ncbi:MAG: cytochrome P450 [Deltaproteobacteria bacterium]|nr:MAG: cytochrome P450 [Deltaproteobacteria bacterium]
MPEMPVLSGLPVLGCLPELRRDRLGLLLRAYREGGDMVRVPIPGRRLYIGTSPSIATAALRQEASRFMKFFALAKLSRPVLGDGLITAEGAHHRRQRKLIAPGLTRREVGRYAEVMARHADELQRRCTAGTTVDVHAEMTRLTLAIASETMFGTSAEAHARAAGDAIHAATSYIARGVGSLVNLPLSWPLPRHLRMRRAVATLDRIVYDIIRDRRSAGRNGAPGSDILGMLLAAQDEEDGTGMTDDQVRDEVMTLFVAGHETTANALTWSLYLLDHHPDVAERLAEEATAVLGGRPPTLEDLPALPYALQVFKEAMRVFPPAYMVGREATEDAVVDGWEIPKGATLLLSIYGLHRRPDLFEDPERFDPDRFAPEREQALPRGAYVPFADGPRVCIGNHFALMEGQIVLAHLAQHVRLRTRTQPVVRPQPRVTLRPATLVALTAERRAG